MNRYRIRLNDGSVHTVQTDLSANDFETKRDFSDHLYAILIGTVGSVIGTVITSTFGMEK